MISKELLKVLACPFCKSKVEEKNESLKCTACYRVYPVRDGIPIMLIEEAKIEKE